MPRRGFRWRGFLCAELDHLNPRHGDLLAPIAHKPEYTSEHRPLSGQAQDELAAHGRSVPSCD
jgi:hypothetical protein